MDSPLTFGEYMRRLRRAKRWGLQELAHATALSISHLSRLENDNVVPSPETVVKLASALDGELERMLQFAECLPPEILARLARRATDAGAALHRGVAADEPSDPTLPAALVGDMDQMLRKLLAKQFGLSEGDVHGLFAVLRRMGEMNPDERRAVLAFLGAGA